MKHWWARIRNGQAYDYGRWVPTGMLSLDDAKFYMSIVYPGMRIKEWLLL